MFDYNSELFDPPAPIAYVTLRNSEKSIEITNVPMLIDTGADATLLPHIFVEKIGVEFSSEEFFELQGFDGNKSQSSLVRLQMIFEGKSFRVEFLTINQNYSIIGRNVLNSITILFDGQSLQWKIL
jgi:predicted aspartyl protease